MGDEDGCPVPVRCSGRRPRTAGGGGDGERLAGRETARGERMGVGRGARARAGEAGVVGWLGGRERGRMVVVVDVVASSSSLLCFSSSVCTALPLVVGKIRLLHRYIL